jgi:hypothetical protein
LQQLENNGLNSGDIVVFASVGAGMNINSIVYPMPQDVYLSRSNAFTRTGNINYFYPVTGSGDKSFQVFVGNHERTRVYEGMKIVGVRLP